MTKKKIEDKVSALGNRQDQMKGKVELNLGVIKRKNTENIKCLKLNYTNFNKMYQILSNNKKKLII